MEILDNFTLHLCSNCDFEKCRFINIRKLETFGIGTGFYKIVRIYLVFTDY